MTGMRRWLAAGALVGMITGCEGGPGLVAPVQPDARVVGEFTATSAVFTDAIDTSSQFDVISQDGRLTFDVDATGRFETVVIVPGRAVLTQTGTVAVVGNQLVFTDEGGVVSRSVPFTMNGNTLTLVDAGATFDFNGGGVRAPAVLNAVLVR